MQIAIAATLIIGVAGLSLHLHSFIKNLFQSQRQQTEIAEKGERIAKGTDLKLYDLKGDVKEVIWLLTNGENGDTIRRQRLHFTRSGIATQNRYDSQNNINSKVKIERNEDGTQSAYENTIKGKDGVHYIKAVYEYDSTGALKTENINIDNSTIARTPIYRNGVCFGRKELLNTKRFTADEMHEYQYTDFDKYGNWTKRNVTKKGVRRYTGRQQSEEYTHSQIESRIITYYE